MVEIANNDLLYDGSMPKGLTATSSVIAIGASITESAPNVYTQQAIDLNLDPLNYEVFVVLACNIDSGFPDAIAATNTSVKSQVTTVTKAASVNIADNTCLAKLAQQIQAAGFVDGGVGFSSQALESPPSTLEYVGIIATNDFFLAIEGTNNAAPKQASVKLYGYRARANATIYAALVQSEVLSI